MGNKLQNPQPSKSLIGFGQQLEVNNSLLSVHASKLTIEKAMKDSPQLSVVKKEFGDQKTGTYLMKLISEVAILTKTDVDPVTSGLVAQGIMQDYWMLRYDEIIVALRNGVRGKYGKTSWGGISFQAIMEWMDKYFVERDEVITRQHEVNKNSWGSNADRTNSDKPIGEIVDEKVWKNKIQRISNTK